MVLRQSEISSTRLSHNSTTPVYELDIYSFLGIIARQHGYIRPISNLNLPVHAQVIIFPNQDKSPISIVSISRRFKEVIFIYGAENMPVPARSMI